MPKQQKDVAPTAAAAATAAAATTSAAAATAATRRQAERAAAAAARAQARAAAAARRAELKENRRRAGGDDALRDVAVAVDDAAWDDAYAQALAAAGVPGVRRAENEVSCSVVFRVAAHALTPSLDLRTTEEEVALTVLLVKQRVLRELGFEGLGAFLRAVAARLGSRRKAYVVFEGAAAAGGGGGAAAEREARCRDVVARSFAGADASAVAAVKFFATVRRTAEHLASLACCVAKAPYRVHATEGKVYAERTARAALPRMLSVVPGLGPATVAAVVAEYPTAALLLRRYDELLAADGGGSVDPKLLLQDLEVSAAAGAAGGGASAVRHVGPAASLAVYEAFVLGGVLTPVAGS
eukprot:Rhum_TRINITY_DN14407_c22_g1::Rhum_TRINITY_DN14407_c22_g1_i1::g.88816::m.88816